MDYEQKLGVMLAYWKGVRDGVVEYKNIGDQELERLKRGGLELAQMLGEAFGVKEESEEVEEYKKCLNKVILALNQDIKHGKDLKTSL